jgi:hypothetical protein
MSAGGSEDQIEPRGALETTHVASRTDDDELTDRLADRGAKRFAELLRRLGP